MTPLKKCTKCGEEKPATLEFFQTYAGNGPRYKPDTLRARCRGCRNEYCKSWMNKSGYYKKNAEKMRDKSKQHRMDNRDSHIAAAKKWREEHPAERRAYRNKKTEILSDWYIKDRIRRQYGMSFKEIPQAVIQSKRKSLKAHRLITKIKKKYENHTQTTEKVTTGLRRRT